MFRPSLVLLLALGSLGAGGVVPIIEAVKSGEMAALRSLLQQGTDVNVADTDGTTALHWAAHRDDVEAVELLIRTGADVKATNRYGVAPLSLAAANGSAAVVERLLKAGADANTTMAGGETALMTAARTGRVDAINVLLAHGADVNARESTRGQNALMWAAAEGHGGAIEALVEAGAEVHARATGPPAPDAPPAPGASAGRRVATRADAVTPLLFAVRRGHLDAVRALLRAGANPSDTAPDGASAVTVAIINWHYEVGALLLDHGADPNASAPGWTALHQLARSRNIHVGMLPPPELTGSLNGLDMATRLIAHGADVNARMTKEMTDGLENRLNRVGATPLMLAAKGVDHELMRILAANGADPRLRNADNTTVGMLAAGTNIVDLGKDSGTNEDAFEAVKLAWELAPDLLNGADDEGETALHGAAFRGAEQVVKFLIDKGARLDARTNLGWTPLTVAHGILYNGDIRTQPRLAVLLIEEMKKRGLPIEGPRSLETMLANKPVTE